MDSFERFGVTADWKKVLPGMVYVDLQENKSKKEIFNAYKNGASVIFTSQNISNPELPVIKVRNVEETMLLMLNNHFQSPQDKLKLIAVSGSNDKEAVLDLLHKVLYREGKALNRKKKNYFYNYFSSLKNMTIEDMFEHLDKLASTGEHFMPIIVDYKLKYFKFINSFKFDCALITGVNSFDTIDQNYLLSSIKAFISQIPENKPIIVNNDDEIVLKALEGSKNTIVITYGLNKKAAVTATSIDINQLTTFNYCLQRSIRTNTGKLLEPFEMPINMNLLGSRNIYNALAIITCALYYDIDIVRIKNALSNYTPPRRRFEINDILGVTVLDNYCSSAEELDKTFEGIQLFNSNKLHMLLAINRSNNEMSTEALVKIMSQWSGILGIDEIILCGCLDVNEKAFPLSINEVRRLKKELNSFVKIKYLDKLQTAIENIASDSKEGEMIIFAGGSELNSAGLLLEQCLKLKHSKKYFN